MEDQSASFRARRVDADSLALTRYQLTELGTMASQFYTRMYARVLRPAFSCATDDIIASPKTNALGKLDHAIAELLQEMQLAA